MVLGDVVRHGSGWQGVALCLPTMAGRAKLRLLRAFIIQEQRGMVHSPTSHGALVTLFNHKLEGQCVTLDLSFCKDG